jgi:hypothetical protein
LSGRFVVVLWFTAPLEIVLKFAPAGVLMRPARSPCPGSPVIKVVVAVLLWSPLRAGKLLTLENPPRRVAGGRLPGTPLTSLAFFGIHVLATPSSIPGAVILTAAGAIFGLGRLARWWCRSPASVLPVSWRAA